MENTNFFTAHATEIIAIVTVVIVIVLAWLLYRFLSKRARTLVYEKVAKEHQGEVIRPKAWGDLPGFICPHGKRDMAWQERTIEHEDETYVTTEVRFRYAHDDPTSLTALIHTKDYFDPTTDEFVGAVFEPKHRWLEDTLVIKSNAPTRLETAMTDEVVAIIRELVEDCDGGALSILVEHNSVILSKVGLKSDYEGVKAHVERCTRLFDTFVAASGLKV